MRALSFIPLAWLLLLPASILAQTLCNGRPEYCDRRYADIRFVGAHNSPFVGFLPQHNQEISVTKQLDLGIRFLQGQTRVHEDTKTLNMCHSSCFLEDAGPVENFLGTIKTWLDGHPEEVVTLLLTNGDFVDISRFDEAFTKSGIKEYVFVPTSSPDALPMDSWPTMGEIIQSGKRLIVFVGKYARGHAQRTAQELSSNCDRLQNRHVQIPIPSRPVLLLLRNPILYHRS